MNNKKVGEFWERNAENWTKLSRLGYDRCRDLINCPGFFSILPDIKGLKGLDIGCGDGYNTRIAAKKGGIMTAIDISKTFIHYCKDEEKKNPLNIIYQNADATELPFLDQTFDFIISTMSLMDISDVSKALDEAYRVLKSGGFFQFSILHPCFNTEKSHWQRNEQGRKIAFVISDYFKELNGEIEEWIFGAAPKQLTDKMEKFKIPRFRKTLSNWLNLLIDKKFIFDCFLEPKPSMEVLEKYPEEYDSLIVPYFLIIRCIKP